MNQTTLIAVVNGQQLSLINDPEPLVPIKPICAALGVNYSTQVEKLYKHPIFHDAVVPLRGITGADGKHYEMLCLPMEYVFGWIFTINPANVGDAARDTIIKYQIECNHALYDHFTLGMRREQERVEKENALLRDRDEITRSIEYTREETARLKKLLADVDGKLSAIRAERLDPQPSLPLD